MDWFNEWWNGLALFSQIMLCVAAPATLILMIQTVLLIFGFGHDGIGDNPSDTSGLDGGIDADISTDVDVSVDGDIGTDIDADADVPQNTDSTSDGSNASDVGTMHFFTVQGFITFFCVFGWTGIISFISNGNVVLSLILAFAFGAAAMFGVAKLMQISGRLAQNGTLNVRNLLGATGTVYLVIPASCNGRGKVSITSGERLLEFDAVTDGDEMLTDGTQIRVVDIRSENVLVVEKV